MTQGFTQRIVFLGKADTVDTARAITLFFRKSQRAKAAAMDIAAPVASIITMILIKSGHR